MVRKGANKYGNQGSAEVVWNESKNWAESRDLGDKAGR